MGSIAEVFAALDAAVEACGATDWDALPARNRVAALDRLERVRRRVRACSHQLTAAVDRCSKEELGGVSHTVIADVLRISPAESKRRLRNARQLEPRTTLTGHTLPPQLPATATAWHAGILDPEHLRTIQRFLHDLPDHIAAADVEQAEAFLVEKAHELRPDQLQKVADRLALTLNPDGRFSDDHRARQRGFTWCGPQRPDGMTVGRLIASPELRAMIDTLLAKLAAPGMCNPDDQTPTVAGDPTQAVLDRDARSHQQRQHDALAALCRNWLGDPRLGHHRGLPVTLIVSTTLEHMQSGDGYAVTGGGSLLPMSDVIRMASHAWHYLVLFDKHTERALYLGRSKRIASADQRIVLHAKDRGCSAPGCDKPGYLSEVHHVDEWADGGLTNIDALTFSCGQHHRLIEPGGWKTRKLTDGSTQWLPPPGTLLKSGTNDFHHPERHLEEFQRTDERGGNSDAA